MATESPNFGPAVEPYWADVRPMVLQTADEVTPVAHVPYSANEGSAFWEQARATYQTGLALTQSQRETALFWRDNPHTSGLPSGHWMQIVRQVCMQQELSLARSVEAYARVGIALHDAFLNCWTWKYRYNLIRPVDYVQLHIDPNWSSSVIRQRSPSTPPGIRSLRRLRPTCSPTSSVRSHSPTSTRSPSGVLASSVPSERRPSRQPRPGFTVASTTRWASTLASIRAVRSGRWWSTVSRPVGRSTRTERDRLGVAMVDLARKLSGILYAMLRDGSAYDPAKLKGALRSKAEQVA